MKTKQYSSPLHQYAAYFQYGAMGLLTTWILALLTTLLLPGPYYFNFFGVVAERTADKSSVFIGWEAFFTAFVFLPLIMAAVDYLNSRTAIN
ncbi:MAG TPA: hypothetical protein VK983_01570 [Candidatus Limnocylindrales bacterium]|nr:hypothetical protein [Candidatus Limnocylindrales bacterium]